MQSAIAHSTRSRNQKETRTMQSAIAHSTRSRNQKETQAMKTSTALITIVSVLTLVMFAAMPVNAATWTGGSDTWDGVDTTHWVGADVPDNGETASLTESSGTDIDIDYTATNLTGTGLAQLSISNSGDGTTTLTLDGTDSLPTQKMSIGTGGAINMTGGTLSHSSDDSSFNFVNTGGTMTMSGGTWTQTDGALGVRGTVEQSGGAVSVSGQLHLHGGSWSISDGTLATGGGQHMYVGPRWGVAPYGPGLAAELNIDGGAVTVGSVLYVGDNGSFGNTGTVTQTAGTISLGSYLVLDTGGTYNLSGGTLNSKNIQSMAAGSVFNHTNGDHIAATGSNIGGTYNFSGGNWKLDDILNVSGTVNWTGGTLGSAAVAGQISKLNLNGSNASWNMQGTTLTVNRSGVGGADSLTMVAGATLQGYGTVQDARYGQGSSWGTFKASGRVIADGDGVDRTLDASRWTNGYLTNPTDNTTDNGWFATNHGKLILPSVTVNNATADYNWGEASADTTIDLVNSARLSFTDLGATTGTLTGSLLATDRTTETEISSFSIPGMASSDLFSVHDLSLTGITFSDFELTIRYDDVAAAGFEDVLQIFHYTDGAWVALDTTVNLANKWVTASGITSFSLFAVGYAIPEPTSALLLGLAGLVLLRRRRR